MSDKPEDNPNPQKEEDPQTLSLEQRLDQYIARSSDEFNNEVIERVRSLVHYQVIYPEKQRVLYTAFLKELDDFRLYYQLHPEWHGQTRSVQKYGKGLSMSFYAAVYRFIRNNIGKDRNKVLEMMNQVLVASKKLNWKTLKTLEDWQRYYAEHPELHGKSTKQLMECKETNRFYSRFRIWANEQSGGDKKKKRQLNRAVIKPILNKWDYFETVEDWVECYNNNTQWHGKAIADMQKDSETGGCGFYIAFRKWVRKQSMRDDGTIDERKRDGMIHRIFSLENYLTIFHRRAQFKDISSLDEAVEAVNEVGSFRFLGFVRNKYALAVTVFPKVLNEYISAMISSDPDASILNQLKQYFGTHYIQFENVLAHLQSLHILKLARDESGNPLSKEDYFRFVRDVLVGEHNLELTASSALDVSTAQADVHKYLAKGDYSDVSVIEQLVGESLNPTMRVRMLLATNPGLKANDTLDAFVKFYADEDECVADVAFNNYFQKVVGLPGVGIARTAKLTQHIAVQGIEHDDRQVLSMSARQFSDKQGKYCPYALITPFVNITTLRDYAAECEEPVVDVLKRVNSTMCRLHSEGYARRTEIASAVFGTEAQRQALEERFRNVDYNKLFTDELCGEHGLCREEGLFASSFKALGIGDWLNNYLGHSAVIIHGDCHDENIVVTADDNIGFVDFGWSRVGIPQEDLCRVLSRYRFDSKINLEEELGVVEDYAAKSAETQPADKSVDNSRNADDGKKIDTEEAKTAYHYATIFHEARICHIYATRMARSSSQANTDGYLKHRSRMVEHALQVFSQEQVSNLAASMDFEMILDEDKRKSLPGVVDFADYAAKNKSGGQQTREEQSSLRLGSSR